MQRLHQVLSILILSTTKLLDMIDRVFFFLLVRLQILACVAFSIHPSIYSLHTTYLAHTTHTGHMETNNHSPSHSHLQTHFFNEPNMHVFGMRQSRASKGRTDKLHTGMLCVVNFTTSSSLVTNSSEKLLNAC